MSQLRLFEDLHCISLVFVNISTNLFQFVQLYSVVIPVSKLWQKLKDHFDKKKIYKKAGMIVFLPR